MSIYESLAREGERERERINNSFDVVNDSSPCTGPSFFKFTINIGLNIPYSVIYNRIFHTA